MSIPDNGNPVRVQRAIPMDVTAIRDPGMKALVLLAASLGWNVIHKPNNPILLKARDGRDRRIPTNTSIRMSVFQANLSTILTHSPGFEPTAGLIDDIVRKTKIDRDHERRLRIAVTEPEEVHQARLRNIERGVKEGISHEEHLTQRVELPGKDPAEMTDDYQKARGAIAKEPTVDPELEPGELSFFGPFDGKDHGRLISKKPYMAKYHGGKHRKPNVRYPSETSYERVWEKDDYKDYECIYCGMVKGSPQAVGSHKQVHIKAGEIKASDPSSVMARTKGIHDPDAPIPGPPPPQRPRLEAPAQLAADAGNILDQIRNLLMGDLLQQVTQLTKERDDLQKECERLRSDWKALRDILARGAADE